MRSSNTDSRRSNDIIFALLLVAPKETSHRNEDLTIGCSGSVPSVCLARVDRMFQNEPPPQRTCAVTANHPVVQIFCFAWRWIVLLCSHRMILNAFNDDRRIGVSYCGRWIGFSKTCPNMQCAWSTTSSKNDLSQISQYALSMGLSMLSNKTTHTSISYQFDLNITVVEYCIPLKEKLCSGGIKP